MTLTDERLNEIEAAAKAATEGPWTRDQYANAWLVGGRIPPGTCVYCQYGPPVATFERYGKEWHTHRLDPSSSEVYSETNHGLVCGDLSEDYDDYRGGFKREEDADFVVLARTAVPELVAEVRRLRGMVPPHVNCGDMRKITIEDTVHPDATHHRMWDSDGKLLGEWWDHDFDGVVVPVARVGGSKTGAVEPNLTK